MIENRDIQKQSSTNIHQKFLTFLTPKDALP